MMREIVAKFGLGEIVRHREAAFRGMVIDVDPVFAGAAGDTGSISPDQPFYQVLAIGAEGGFIAYAPEDCLEPDPELLSVAPAAERQWFNVDAQGRHAPKAQAIH